MQFSSILISIIFLFKFWNLQNSQKSTVLFAKIVSEADSAWKARPLPYIHLLHLAPEPDIYNPTEIQKELFKKSYIDRFVALENKALNFRNWGINFWIKYPSDPRRFDWLLETLHYPPKYYKNPVQAISYLFDDLFMSEPDTSANNSWEISYQKFRKEFISANDVTESMKQDLEESEFANQMDYLIRYDLAYYGRLDLNEIAYKMLSYAQTFFVRFNLDQMTGRFWQSHELTFLIPYIVSNDSAFGLQTAQIRDFLRVMAASKFQFLADQAQAKLSLLALMENSFELKRKTLFGKEINLSNLHGKYVLIDFWSTGCSSCIQKMPELKMTYQKHKLDGLEVISVCIDPLMNRNKILNIYRKIGADWPILLIGGKKWADTTSLANRIWSKYGFQSVPQMILLDKSGKLIAYNDDLLYKDRLESFIDKQFKKDGYQPKKLSVSDENRFTITASLVGMKDGQLVYLVNNRTTDTLARTIAQGGKFIFEGRLRTSPEWYSVRFKDSVKWETIFMDNSSVKITGLMKDWPQVDITGSVANDEYLNYLRLENSHTKYKDSVDKLVDSTILAERVKYIDQHRNGLYASYLLDNTGSMSMNEKEKRYMQLSEDVKSSTFGLDLKEKIDIDRLFKTIKPGNEAPDFSSVTSNDQNFRLYEVLGKGKLTLVNFWDGRSPSCRSEIPNLVKVYDSFHKKGLNIISVSFDVNKQNWENTIAREKMVWYQVSQLRGRDEYAGRLYHINGIPANILLDSTGKIIAIDAAGSGMPSENGSLRGEQLYLKVEDILDK